ncbi:MAG: ribonuclease P protein component 1 [Candidatus Bathyarchaeia archaeon]
MKITPEIVQQEFIGLMAKVARSSNPVCVGIKGTIINETRNTFVIMQNKKRKTIAKNQSVFRFTLPDATIVEIEGTVLLGKPEDRLKRRIRRLW